VRIRGPLPDQAGNTQHPTSSTVNRMGYGDPEALQIIREASKNEMFDLREHPGVRIGVVISDDRTMVSGRPNSMAWRVTLDTPKRTTILA